MTPRERFKNVINFRKVDKLPWVEVFYDETIVRWINEGLNIKDIVYIDWDISRDGTVLLNFPAIKGFNPYKFFGCINLHGCFVPIDVGPIPRFKQMVIRENDKYLDVMLQTGVITRRFKESKYVWYSMPMFLEYPVKDRKTWEEYKNRLDPKDPRRYPKDWNKDSYIRFFENYQDGPTEIRLTGLYGFGAQLMGIYNFNLSFYKDPELIEDIANYWEYFTIETIKDAVETLKDRIDIVFWWEDMAEKHGPFISPKIFKEFFLSHYKNVTNFLRKNKIDKIMVDSDGNLYPIIDCFISAGITGFWPLEVNAGMDAIEIKKKYGNKLFLIGNIDKQKVNIGGELMKKEIDSKVPMLKEMGGYIPCLDHLVPTDMSYKRFIEYREYLLKYL